MLDVNDNTLISTSGTPGESVRQLLRTGYNGGAWTGPRLTSSAAAADASRTTALGYGVTPQGELIVKYTSYGDTDLNGIINFDDYARVDNGFNNAGADWFHGDFNYDGHVNFDDFALIDLAFNHQASPMFSVAVPESSICGIASLAATFLVRRRVGRAIR